MKHIVLALALAAGSANAAVSVDINFTDADIVQREGGLPGCIVEFPGSTFVLTAPCSDVIKDVVGKFHRAFPELPYTVTLNGESLSGA